MSEDEGQKPLPPKPGDPAPKLPDENPKLTPEQAEAAAQIKAFEINKGIFAKRLNKLFDDMAEAGIGMVPTFYMEVSPIGGTVVFKPRGTNYNLVPVPKKVASKKDQKAKKKARKKNK